MACSARAARGCAQQYRLSRVRWTRPRRQECRLRNLRSQRSRRRAGPAIGERCVVRSKHSSTAYSQTDILTHLLLDLRKIQMRRYTRSHPTPFVPQFTFSLAHTSLHTSRPITIALLLNPLLILPLARKRALKEGRQRALLLIQPRPVRLAAPPDARRWRP